MTVEQQVAAFLAVSYGLQARVHSVVRGVNWTFRADVDNDSFYFVRLYRPLGRSRADICSEISSLLSIQATRNLAVAKPIAATGGIYLSDVNLDGEIRRDLVVFSAARGRSIEMSAEDFSLAGKALADLHSQHDVALASQDRRVMPEDVIGGTMERMARHSPSGDRAATRLSSIVKPLLTRAAATEAPMGFCHGDFRVANMTKENGRVILFDFDDCGIGPQWLDLATMAWWLEQDQGSGGVLWRALLCGYKPSAQTSGFDRAICEMVAIQQFRSLRFLLDYCTLDDALWAETFERTFELVARASSSALRIMQ